MRILVDEQIPFLADSLSKVGDVVTFSARNLSKEFILETNCKFLFVRSNTKVDKDLLDGSEVLFVGTATSGVDHIDLDYLNSKGIYFVDAKGSNANSVAEYVVFSILHWALEKGSNLCELTIGIIGFGNIGSLVGKYSHLLGLKLLVYDPPLLEKIEFGKENNFPEYVTYCELKELLSKSNIVTNHVPLTSTGNYPTVKMLNKNMLDLIQEDALFIHTSRGGVVSETDLLQILTEKRVSVVIDVWENEPQINSNLVDLCDISTPHIAGYSYEGKLRGTLKMLQSFEKFTNVTPNYSILEKEMQRYVPLDKRVFKSPKLLYNKLKETRKLLEDSFFLKSIIYNTDEEGKANYFDKLRKFYPKRHEILDCL
ncbi:MAG: 4-phosphoerythronate dehydrogenase [Ignavibacteria bacterium]|nr:4-phosphoerythronate dehydrogenase [Ignavibacteria bacterium]